MIYTDFGYSLDSTSLSRSTTCGTPSPFTRKYSAPEFLDYDYRNSRSDVFSLGCVFIEMLSSLTQTVPHDDITSFVAVIDKLHAQIPGWQVPSNVTKVPSIVISMTMCEPSNRSCSVCSARAILESPECCCLECRAGSSDPSSLGAQGDNCFELAVRKGKRCLGQSICNATRREQVEAQTDSGYAAPPPIPVKPTQRSTCNYSAHPSNYYPHQATFSSGSTNGGRGRSGIGYGKSVSIKPFPKGEGARIQGHYNAALGVMPGNLNFEEADPCKFFVIPCL
jgi:serine/threonine protein kinase